MTAETTTEDNTTSETPKGPPATADALKLVKNNVYLAAGAGLLGVVPIPVLDFAAVTAVNVKMLRELANFYNLEFKNELAKSSVGALIGGATAPWLTISATGTLMRFIPGLGQLFALVTGPAAAAAVTYAVGRVFVLHFGSGGNFLDFDPDRFRRYFNEELEKGRERAESDETQDSP